jgi:hypothetical protein
VTVDGSAAGEERLRHVEVQGPVPAPQKVPRLVHGTARYGGLASLGDARRGHSIAGVIGPDHEGTHRVTTNQKSARMATYAATAENPAVKKPSSAYGARWARAPVIGRTISGTPL